MTIHTRLDASERDQIALLAAEGKPGIEIARLLGRSQSSISRELRRNTTPEGTYTALQAQARSEARKAQAASGRWLDTPEAAPFKRELLTQMTKHYSLEQSLLQMEVTHPSWDLPSKETVYSWLYQGDDRERQGLRSLLVRPRKRRRKRCRSEDFRGKIPRMVPLTERPPEATDRTEAGHLEGDLVIGKGNKSAVVTLVDRRTRFLWVRHVPSKRKKDVTRVLVRLLLSLPPDLVKSLTWDQGRELADHEVVTEKTGVQVYFCDPHSPWQRPQNEHTNGVLRKYLPKGTDLLETSPQALRQVQRLMNKRRLKVLSKRSPAEEMSTCGYAIAP